MAIILPANKIKQTQVLLVQDIKELGEKTMADFPIEDFNSALFDPSRGLKTLGEIGKLAVQREQIANAQFQRQKGLYELQQAQANEQANLLSATYQNPKWHSSNPHDILRLTTDLRRESEARGVPVRPGSTLHQMEESALRAIADNRPEHLERVRQLKRDAVNYSGGERATRQQEELIDWVENGETKRGILRRGPDGRVQIFPVPTPSSSPSPPPTQVTTPTTTQAGVRPQPTQQPASPQQAPQQTTQRQAPSQTAPGLSPYLSPYPNRDPQFQLGITSAEATDAKLGQDLIRGYQTTFTRVQPQLFTITKGLGLNAELMKGLSYRSGAPFVIAETLKKQFDNNPKIQEAEKTQFQAFAAQIANNPQLAASDQGRTIALTSNALNAPGSKEVLPFEVRNSAYVMMGGEAQRQIMTTIGYNEFSRIHGRNNPANAAVYERQLNELAGPNANVWQIVFLEMSTLPKEVKTMLTWQLVEKLSPEERKALDTRQKQVVEFVRTGRMPK